MSLFRSFIGGYGRSQSVVANPSTLQNLYTQRLPAGSVTNRCFYPTQGMERFGAVAQVGGKRFFSTAATDSRVFSVTGQRLYEWFADGSAIDRGTVAADGNPAVIFTNGEGGQQLGICAGGNFYILDLQTNVLTQVAFLNGRATQGGFSAGYFLVFDINTGTVYQSDLFDGTTFDPLNFFQRSVQADDWNALYCMSWGQVFLPGTKTRDSYYNAGTFPIPFAPASSATQADGCAATFSVVECGKQIAWLGTAAQGGYSVYAATGYEGVKISTEAIDYAISQASQQQILNATAEAYSDQGHDFYLLTVGAVTYVFDFAENEWTTLRSFEDATSGMLTAWRPRWHCFGFNKHLWLDANSGVCYEGSSAYVYDVDDLPIQRQRTSPVICVENQMLDIGDIELLAEVGVGQANDPGANPMIGLEISVDGGQTWGRQRWQALGRQGQYEIRPRWQANGSGRKVAFRVTVTDPVFVRIFGLLVDLRGERGQSIRLDAMAEDA